MRRILAMLIVAVTTLIGIGASAVITATPAHAADAGAESDFVIRINYTGTLANTATVDSPTDTATDIATRIGAAIGHSEKMLLRIGSTRPPYCTTR